MKCPVCNVEMKQFQMEHTELDMCEKCQGIWFDKGEFQTILKSLENNSEVSYDKYNPFGKKIDVIDPKLYTKRHCSRCGEIMEQFNYAYDSNIFLDKCPSCGSIWADKGEVLKAAIHNKGYPKLEAIGRKMTENATNMETLKDLSRTAEELKSSGIRALFLPKIILPLSDDNPRICVPFVTISIILANILALIFGVIAIIGGKDIISLALVSSNIIVGKNLHSLITSMFLHAGILHLFFNMFFLWIFGDNVEDYLGHFRFLAFYLLFGIFGGLLFTATSINTPLASVPAIGASGAISGIIAAYFLIYPNARVNILFFSKIIKAPAFLYIGWYILMQIIFVSIKSATGYEAVGYSAHLGGIIGALLIVFMIKQYRSRKSKRSSLSRT